VSSPALSLEATTIHIAEDIEVRASIVGTSRLVWCWRSTETQRMAGHTCTSVCDSERKRRGPTEARAT